MPENPRPSTSFILRIEHNAGAALVGPIGCGPVEQYGDAIAKADEEEDVGGQPEQPREDARETKAAQIHHGGHAADGGEVAVIGVVEWL